MNTFEFRFRLDNNVYDVYIDSSKNENKRIVINNCEVINEKYTLSLNNTAYIIYYPIKIGENQLVISIDDKPFEHVYNVYLNNKSLLDGSSIDEKYLQSHLKLKNGFKRFVKENWLNVLKENLIAIVSSVFCCTILLQFTILDMMLRIALAFIIIPVLMPILIFVEW